ncbi:MAG: glucose-6-phosphate isomerase [Terriglobales bacterium]
MKLPCFDYANTLESAVGAGGLHPGDLDEAAATAAVAAFRKRVDSGEIGFPHLPEDRGVARAVTEFADDLRDAIDDVLVLGIGGSALGSYALDVALRGPHPLQAPVPGSRGARGGRKTSARRGAKPRLVVLDNIDPGLAAAALEQLNPRRTAVLVIAKSGSTAETLSQFLIVRQWMVKALGRKARARIIAITDPHKGDLLAIAKEERYPLFFVPPNVGGRFTVLSPVGLLPAALIGVNIEKLLGGARAANAVCWSAKLAENPALASAAVHHALNTKRGKSIEVVFAYSSFLWGAAFWYRQLWAESLGKRVDRSGKVVECGQTPVAALGATDQHSQLQLYREGPRDKMITFWRVERPRADLRIPRDFTGYDSCGYLGGKKMSALFDAERTATEAALTSAGRPNCRWALARVDEATLGAFFQMLEFQTAFAGELYGVDAFDQPGVELGKKMTYGLMGRKGYEEFANKLPRRRI